MKRRTGTHHKFTIARRDCNGDATSDIQSRTNDRRIADASVCFEREPACCAGSREMAVAIHRDHANRIMACLLSDLAAFGIRLYEHIFLCSFAGPAKTNVELVRLLLPFLVI